MLDGEFPAHLWIKAHGDSLVEAALQCGVIEWQWQHFDWGGTPVAGDSRTSPGISQNGEADPNLTVAAECPITPAQNSGLASLRAIPHVPYRA